MDLTFEKKTKQERKEPVTLKVEKIYKKQNIFSISTLIEIRFLYTVRYFKVTVSFI